MIDMNFTKRILGIFIGLSLYSVLFAAEGIPQRPDPPRLVNDFAGLLSPEQVQALESKLVAFDDSTSTQIAVVIVNDLKGYDANQFAYEIGHSWQVGQKGKNNGVVILVKPKTSDSNGKVSIQAGYGMEHLVTDALARRIIEIEMIPQFRQNNYFAGIDAGVYAVMLASKGQYKAMPKKQASQWPLLVVFFSIFIIIIIITVINSQGQNNHHSLSNDGSRSNLPFWLLLGAALGSSESRSSGSWGSFSSGSDGFGGFGGGDFGGGGAGGSW